MLSEDERRSGSQPRVEAERSRVTSVMNPLSPLN